MMVHLVVVFGPYGIVMFPYFVPELIVRAASVDGASTHPAALRLVHIIAEPKRHQLSASYHFLECI